MNLWKLANNAFKKELGHIKLSKIQKRLWLDAYVVGYEQAWHDALFREAQRAFRSYNKVFNRRYDLQDAEKETKR